MISEEVQQAVQEALNADIKSVKEISGGSINQAAKMKLADGRTCFLKWNAGADPDMFVKEHNGLEILASSDTGLRIPTVYTTGKTENGTGFLIQEFITEGQPQEGSAANFGRSLAALHQQSAELFGLDHDNYIGKLPQSNTQHHNWIDFFIEERMEPQLQMAVDTNKLGEHTVAQFHSMYKKLPDIFPDEPPSLLHGDLWGGNYFYDGRGQAAIYDPAVYYGHREIELAFTHLFGGFSSDFYRAYEDAWPREPGFTGRKDIYNLYPLLVHTNLFGGGYGRQVQSIVQRF